MSLPSRPGRDELLAEALEQQALRITQALGEPIAGETQEDVVLRSNLMNVAGRLEGIAITLQASLPRPVMRDAGDERKGTAAS